MTDASAMPSRRRVVVTLATASGVLAAGGGTAWWLLGRDHAPPQPWAAQPLHAYERAVAPPALWTRSDTGSPDGPAPVPLGARVAYAAAGGGIAARTVAEGRRVWRERRPDPVRHLLAAPGLLLAADTTGTVLALDPRSGSLQWSVPEVQAALLLAADQLTLYVLTEQGEIAALSLKGGKKLWTRPCPVRSPRMSPARAAAANARVVLYGSEGDAAALDATTGVVVWRRKELSDRALAPCTADGVVYLGGRDLLALSLQDGRERWHVPSRAGGAADTGAGWGEPAVYEGTVYARDGGLLRPVQAGDGSGVGWALALSPAPDHPAPVVQHRTVCVPTGVDGSLDVAVFDLHKGTRAWTYSARGTGRWRLAAAGNRVFAARGTMVSALPVI